MIKLLFFDVDGTLTDGKIYMSENGEAVKAFDIKDGYGIKVLLPQHNIIPIIITGRLSKITENRAFELNIHELYQGALNKLDILLEILRKYDCPKESAAYFGDDILDIPCMLQCGIVGCPADAVDQVKSISQYVCQKEAGHGAAREFIDWLISSQK